MATVLDFSILGSLSVVFVFIAVFVASWGLFYFVNPFRFSGDDQKKIYSVLAFALSFILILSPTVVGIVTFSIPWLAVIVMIGFFMLFFARMFHPGLDGAQLIGQPVVYGFLIFFTALVFIFGFAAAFGQGLLGEQPGVAQEVDVVTGGDGDVDAFVPVDQIDQGVAPPAADIDTGAPGTDTPATGSFGSNLVLTLFHPKILGMLFMLVLATITILLIAR